MTKGVEMGALFISLVILKVTSASTHLGVGIGNLGVGNDFGMDRVHGFNRPGKGKIGNTIKYAVDSRT